MFFDIFFRSISENYFPLYMYFSYNYTKLLLFLVPQPQTKKKKKHQKIFCVRLPHSQMATFFFLLKLVVSNFICPWEDMFASRFSTSPPSRDRTSPSSRLSVSPISSPLLPPRSRPPPLDPFTLPAWQDHTLSTTTKVIFGKEEKKQEKEWEQYSGKRPKRLSLFSPIPEEALEAIVKGEENEEGKEGLFAYHDDVVERMAAVKRDITPFPIDVDLNQRISLWFFFFSFSVPFPPSLLFFFSHTSLLFRKGDILQLETTCIACNSSLENKKSPPKSTLAAWILSMSGIPSFPSPFLLPLSISS